VTEALPATDVLVAVTVCANEPAAVPAVNRPLVSIVPPAAATDHTRLGSATTLPCASFPTAVNCCVPPVVRVIVAGVTAMVASEPTVTVTDEPAEDTEPIAATTVLANVPALSPAVKRPLELIVPPPCATDHVTVRTIVFPFESFTVAVN
jgi:hypothetical protein